MTGPVTTPGLGGGAGAPAADAPEARDAAVAPDAAGSLDAAGALDCAEVPRVATSVDEAMQEAELKLAEQQNREIYEREKRRRVVDEQTRGKLAKVTRGTKEHFDVLALRQKWTLPLDDDDYRLWMQKHLLAEHGSALAEEASQQRRERAKAVARGPGLVVAVLLLIGVVAGLGWWLRGGGAPADAPAAGSVPAGEAPTPDLTLAPAAAPGHESAGASPAVAPGAPPASGASPAGEAPAGDVVAPSTSGGAAAPGAPQPTVTTSAGATAPDSTRPGSTAAGATAPGATAPGATAPRPATAPGGTGRPADPGGKKDIWEREF